MAQAKGVAGVVIGALTAEGDIDIPTCQRLTHEAKGMSITFHRAFDECRNPSEALEQIISLGCDRLLTSGHAPSVSEGLELLKRMVIQAGERIIILPGCGVTPENASVIMEATGTREIHGSLRRNGHTDKKMVRQQMDLKIFVDADADDRLIRVVQRDIVERGRTVAAVMERYERVLNPM